MRLASWALLHLLFTISIAQPATANTKFQWHPFFKRNLEDRQHFNAQKILELVQQKNAQGQYSYQNINQLLGAPLFQELQGDIGLSTVYMGTSRALFRSAATRDHPRILNTFGTTAYAYYTHPEHERAYESLEVIDTDPETLKLTFYMLEYKHGKPIVRKNLTPCVRCHRRRHNWSIYRLWPGMVEDHNITEATRIPDHANDIGFTMDIWEMNMARIAKALLREPKLAEIEKLAIAGLLDCPLQDFPFADDPKFLAIQDEVKKQYNEDAIELIDDVNRTNGTDHRYERLPDGSVRFHVLLNLYDPQRLAIMKYLLAQIGSRQDVREWSTSRNPAGQSYLMQTSGGLGLNRLAYYLIHNSKNSAALKALVPESVQLTHTMRSKPAPSVCQSLTAK